MKTKRLNILLANIFVLVFLIGFASAALTFSSIPTLSKNVGTNTAATITITSDTNETVSFSGLASITDTNGKIVNFTLPSPIVFASIGTQTVTLYYSVPEGFNFKETDSTTLTSTGTVPTTPVSQIIYFENTPTKSHTRYANDRNMDITIDKIKVENGYGKDNSWYPLDEISVNINVENNNANSGDKIRNIVVEWGLYNKQDGKWIIEEKESKFNLNEGDNKKLTINFKLDNPNDFKDNGDYVFYAWATGDNEEFNDAKTSVSADPEDIEINLDNDFVTLYNIVVPETIQCNSEIQISAEAWNIGLNDQNSVYVTVYNKELGINEKVNVGDINSLDSSDFNFNFQLPEDVKAKQYYLSLTVYDENDDVFINGNDDKAIFSVPLNVQGNCTLAKTSVTAVLESGGQAGKPLVVKATIVNTGTKTTSYSLNAAGYAAWASSATLDKTSLTLNSGESAEVLLTFDVKKEALGTNLFNLEVLSGNELVVSQPVQVDITKQSAFLGITGNFFSGDNKYIWGIGALNLILIILIIIIAVRISRRK